MNCHAGTSSMPAITYADTLIDKQHLHKSCASHVFSVHHSSGIRDLSQPSGIVAAQEAAQKSQWVGSAPAAQQLQHEPQLDGVVAVDGGRQRARQHLQHVRLRGQRLDVADVGRRQPRRRCGACAGTQPRALSGSVSSGSANAEAAPDMLQSLQQTECLLK